MDKSTMKKVLIAVGVFLCILVLILFLVKGKHRPEPGTDAAPVIEGYDISGAWYADRENGDTLVLSLDGSYTSSNWLLSGTYNIVGDMIELTDQFGDMKTLTYLKDGNQHQLHFNAGSSGFSYYRTEQEVEEIQQQRQAEEAEKQTFYEAALMQILTTGDWEGSSTDDDTSYTLHFDADKYIETITWKEYLTGEGKEQKRVVSYNITDIEVKDGNYYITLEGTEEAHHISSKINAAILIKEDNTYVFSSSGFIASGVASGLLWCGHYSKTVTIDFTQPGGSPEASGQQSLDEHHSIPFSDQELLELAERDEKEIIGTWKGTRKDRPKSDADYWTFVFKKDGTYSFNDGSSTVTGTFKLTFEFRNDTLYYSTLHLTAEDGATEDYPFYITNTNPQQLIFSLDAEVDHPPYDRQP